MLGLPRVELEIVFESLGQAERETRIRTRRPRAAPPDGSGHHQFGGPRRRPGARHVEVPGRPHLIGLGDGDEGRLGHGAQTTPRRLNGPIPYPKSGTTRRATEDGREPPPNTSWSAERKEEPVAIGSPVPLLRA